MCSYSINCKRPHYSSGFCRYHAKDHLNKNNYANDRILSFCTTNNCIRVSYLKNGLCKKCLQQQPLIMEQRYQWQIKNVSRRKEILKKYNAGIKHKSTHKKYRSTLSGRYNILRNGASRRGFELHISKEEYKIIMEKVDFNCFYCTCYVGAGSALDRINNLGHYTLENVIVCCGECNKLRGARMTVEETLEIVKTLQKLRNTTNIWNTNSNLKEIL